MAIILLPKYAAMPKIIKLKHFRLLRLTYIKEHMNRSIGIILIVLGAAMLIWTGFTYTKKEKVLDAGPIEISANTKERVNWPPYLGGILLAGGIIIIASTKRK